MNKNKLLKEYFKKFDELPPLLKTVSYEDDNYQIALMNAIETGEKLTYDNIGEFFNTNYDIIPPKKSFSKFKK